MLDYSLLNALLAVEQSGSFEKAAKTLGISASAISQRVKLLEERIGAVLIYRRTPCIPTAVGRRLCRHSESVALLETDLMKDLERENSINHIGRRFNIAVNADSLSTWFKQVIAPEKGQNNHIIPNIIIEDQDHSIELMRNGDVLAAVTNRKNPIQGFKSFRLGSMPYIATASPSFMQYNFPNGITSESLGNSAVLQYNQKDQLHSIWMEKVTGLQLYPPLFTLPSSQGFVDACLCGVGWGMNPLGLVEEHIQAGRLMPLVPDTIIYSPLYWHVSRVIQKALNSFTNRIQNIARIELVQS